MSYYGYQNWKTWNVVLWLNNHEPWYRAMVDAVDARRKAGLKIGPTFAKEFVKDVIGPNGTPDYEGLYRSYRGVDWNHVARMMLEHSTEPAFRRKGKPKVAAV